MINKITTGHKGRQACIYIRQSTSGQVIHHRESQRLQYHLVERAKELGWSQEYIRVIDSDLGTSASGSVDRLGFRELLSAVCEGKIGAIFSIEVLRLARNGREWHTLLEICAIMRTVLVDQDAIYNLNLSNDRLLLCILGTLLYILVTCIIKISNRSLLHFLPHFTDWHSLSIPTSFRISI